MRKTMIRTVGLFLSLAAANAMAGPGGFFFVIGQGMTVGAAKSDAISKASAVCAGQGKSLSYSEVVTVQQLGSLWRAQLMVRCS